MLTIDPIDFRQVFYGLPTRHKAVIGLRAMGYTQEEAKDILGISRTAVGTLEQAALATIRKADLGINEERRHLTVIRLTRKT